MIQITDKIQEVVDSMVLDYNILSVEENDGKYTLQVDKTWYLNTGIWVTIDDNKYKIESFIQDSELVLIPKEHEESPVVGDYILPNPIFYHGKTKAINVELLNEQDAYLRPPILWLWEIFDRTEPEDVESIIDSEGEVRLIFLLPWPNQSWETSDQYTNIIKPLTSVIDYFQELLYDFKGVGKLQSKNRINHVKFGNYSLANSADTERNMFSIDLSGIEYPVNIPLTKMCN